MQIGKFIFSLIFFTSVEAQSLCHQYEVEARLQCTSKDVCELILYSGSFSEKKISLKNIPLQYSAYKESFVRANIIMLPKTGRQDIATLIEVPMRIPAPVNLGSMKKKGEKLCP